MPGAKPEGLIADGQRNSLCRRDSNAPEELFKQLPELGVNPRLRSRAWSLRRTAAPAGWWLYRETNCLARRFTASVVRTRPGAGQRRLFHASFRLHKALFTA
jgi:hypothetical protein